jgi:hypothetical protein
MMTGIVLSSIYWSCMVLASHLAKNTEPIDHDEIVIVKKWSEINGK